MEDSRYKEEIEAIDRKIKSNNKMNPRLAICMIVLTLIGAHTLFIGLLYLFTTPDKIMVILDIVTAVIIVLIILMAIRYRKNTEEVRDLNVKRDSLRKEMLSKASEYSKSPESPEPSKSSEASVDIK